MDSPSAEPETAADQSSANGDQALEKIALSACSQNPFLNISQLKVEHPPESLLNLTHLQFLYMTLNGLKDLPSDFFSALPNLKWLDLRANRLRCIPAVDLALHAFLEYLLLEDNCISQLPIELGYVRSLRGLALSGNPLDFPHAEVVAAGVKAIKAYLREVHEGHLEIEGRLAEESTFGEAGDVEPDDSEATEEVVNSEYHLEDSGTAQRVRRKQSQEQQQLLTAQTAPLHRQQGQQIRQRVSAPKPLALKPSRQSDRHNLLVNRFPEPPGPGLVERHAAEERRDARRREALQRQEAVLQRRRDTEASRQWREESRKLQMARAHEQLVRGPVAVARDSEVRIRGAPFNAGWEAGLMSLPTHSDVERQRREGGGLRPEPRPEPLSAEAQSQLERQQRQREAEIAQQVQQHATALMERRRMAAAEGQRLTATQAVEAARRDVEIAMAMQRELALRRAQLENRTLALKPEDAPSGRQRQQRRN